MNDLKNSDSRVRTITAIDLGTKYITVLTGDIEDSGIRVRGFAKENSEGIKRGSVSQLQRTLEVLRRAVAEVEDQTGEPITKAVVNISGHISRCVERTITITRRRPKELITRGEIDKLMESAKNVDLKTHEQVIYTIPVRFDVDDYIGKDVDELDGMIGTNISATYKLFIGKTSFISTLERLFDLAHIEITDRFMAPVASAFAALTPDEMELGCAMLDIGAGTTDLLIMKDNRIRHIGVIPFAGNSITEDIRHKTSTSLANCEKMKVKYGCCIESAIKEDKTILIHGSGGREDKNITFKALAHVIEARMTEILEAVAYKIEESGYKYHLPAGVVITGGCAYMDRISELTQSVLGMPVRLASPSNKLRFTAIEDVFSANSSTAVGLALCKIDKMGEVPSNPVPDDIWLVRTVPYPSFAGEAPNLFNGGEEESDKKTETKKPEPKKDKTKAPKVKQPSKGFRSLFEGFFNNDDEA